MATEASQPSIESLKLTEKNLSEDLDNLTGGETTVYRAISKLRRSRNKCDKGIKAYFGNAIEKLETHRNLLLSEVASWTDEQMFILNAQLE